MSRLLARAARQATGLRAPLPAQPTRAASTASKKALFSWEDPLASKTVLKDDEIAIAEMAERYCQEQLLPRVLRRCPAPALASHYTRQLS